MWHALIDYNTVNDTNLTPTERTGPADRGMCLDRLFIFNEAWSASSGGVWYVMVFVIGVRIALRENFVARVRRANNAKVATRSSLITILSVCILKTLSAAAPPAP
jgi:hypothetical protein